jgi:7-carboxy-7-deazaguanine synthase (Cx14CxxC type)
MMYSIKEIFLTLQGEGVNAGRVAVFCRFAGCNLWSGRAQDRAEAMCDFCDTDFVGTDGVGGGKFATAAALATSIVNHWPPGQDARLVVFTGGEPLLQLDAALIQTMQALDFEIAVESNGTLAAPAGIDWLCVSPKSGTELKQRCGDELKLVYPQADLDPAAFLPLDFTHFLLQPRADKHCDYTRQTIDYCLAHPRWRLSMQTHKWLGIA